MHGGQSEADGRAVNERRGRFNGKREPIVTFDTSPYQGRRVTDVRRAGRVPTMESEWRHNIAIRSAVRSDSEIVLPVLAPSDDMCRSDNRLARSGEDEEADTHFHRFCQLLHSASSSLPPASVRSSSSSLFLSYPQSVFHAEHVFSDHEIDHAVQPGIAGSTKRRGMEVRSRFLHHGRRSTSSPSLRGSWSLESPFLSLPYISQPPSPLFSSSSSSVSPTSHPSCPTTIHNRVTWNPTP